MCAPKTSEHASTALMLHPVHSSRAALDPLVEVEQVDLEKDSSPVTDAAIQDTWSGVAAYEALCAVEVPGFPTRTFAPWLTDASKPNL